MPDFGFFPESPGQSASPTQQSRMSTGSPSSSPRRARGSSINGTSAGQNIVGTPPTASHSLAAAATLNAGLHNESRRSTGSLAPQDNNGVPSAARRRSSIRMNLNLNDPALPAPGELAMSPAGMNRLHSSQSGSSPTGGQAAHHHRAPSLGDIHQEMESETEAQVNRLLGMIRQQQAQIQSLQQGENGTAVAAEEGNPLPDRSHPLSTSQHASSSGPLSQTHASGIIAPARTRSPYRPSSSSMSRQASYQSHASSHHSPSIPSRHHPLGSPGEEHHVLPPAAVRDESAFYQAETQTLTRENQMLKQRIRELERQLGELGGGPASLGGGSHGGSTQIGEAAAGTA